MRRRQQVGEHIPVRPAPAGNGRKHPTGSADRPRCHRVGTACTCVRPLLLIPLLVLSSQSVCPSPAQADEAAIQGIGAAIEPMAEHPSVAMEQMDVVIDMFPRHARVDCRFVLHNQGPRTEVRVGFPERSVYQQRASKPVGFSSFATWVDGKPADARIEGLNWDELEMHWSRWRVKTLAFGDGQRRRVRVQYSAPLGESGEPGRVFAYLVSTGASWHGPIGHARVRIRGHYDPSHSWLQVPDHYYRVSTTTFEWDRRALEPTGADDLELTYYEEYLGFDTSPPDFVYMLDRPAFIKAGVLWGPVRALADWSRSDLRWQRGCASIAHDDIAVEIWPGKPWIDVNGERIALPGRPWTSRGRVVVPMAVIARALGAQVAFDQDKRVVSLRMPPHEQPAGGQKGS